MGERSDLILLALTLFSRSLHYKYSISESCVDSISWINRWNWIKLAQIYHWDWGKKWLDFGDLYLVFKVTPALWNSSFDRKKLVCTLYRTNGWNFPWPDFQGHYIIKTLKNDPCVHPISWIIRWNLFKPEQILHWDKEKKWLDFGDLDLIFKVTLTLWNSNFDRKKLRDTFISIRCTYIRESMN